VSEPPGSISLHASAVVIGEAAILIRGASGAGKSSLALGLITAAERAGRFARLVGDDRIELAARNGRLVAWGHARIGGMVERRGQGILQMDYEPAAIVRLVVDILGLAEAKRFPEEMDDRITLCGIDLPLISLLKDTSAYDSALVVLARLRQDEAI